MFYRKTVVLLALGLTLLAAGCDDQAIDPPGEQARAADILVLSVSGELVSKAEMEIRTKDLAKYVALALADETLRLEVYDAMQASRFKEGKLHFTTLFLDSEGSVRSAMALKSGKSESELATLLGGVVDLEFYMPVDEHRAQWQGDDNLIVATVLDDDGSLPVGFDLAGMSVLMDAEVPPNTPTLALVPVETRFEESVEEDIGFAGAYNWDGVWMLSSTITDDFEGYLMGDPEFEVHAYKRGPTGLWLDKSCSGEKQVGPFYFNQDEDVAWSGQVLLVQDVVADTGKVQFQVWENDSDECKGASDGRPAGGSSADSVDLVSWASDVVDIVTDDTLNLVQKGVKVLWEVYELNDDFNDDDMVGIIEWPPLDCWPEATGGIWADITSEDTGHAKEGWAKLDNNFGERDAICTLSTTISGPTEITTCPTMIWPNPEASYTAGYSGSSGTPSFQWMYDGLEVGTNSSSYEIPNDDLTDGTHMLEVITNRGGEQATDSHSIELTEEATCGGMD